MLSGVILSVVMLSYVMHSAVMLNVFVINVKCCGAMPITAEANIFHVHACLQR
jgi:hypothetical protein